MNVSVSIAGAPGVLPEGLVFGSETGELIMIDFEGKKIWEEKIEGQLYGMPVVSDDTIVVGVAGGEFLLAAYDFEGNQIWQFTPEK